MEHNIDLNYLANNYKEINRICINGKMYETTDRKTGRWIKSWGSSSTTYKCSNCNITQTVTVFENKPQFKFCPYCGTQMFEKIPIKTYNIKLKIKYEKVYPFRCIIPMEFTEEVRKYLIGYISNLLDRKYFDVGVTLGGDIVEGIVYLDDVSQIDYDLIKKEFALDDMISIFDRYTMKFSGYTMEVEVNEKAV